MLIHVVYYSTLPIRYLAKFSRATSERILLELVAGSSLILLISSLILLAISLVMFSHRFDTLLLPESPLGLLVAGIAFGLFIYLFSTTFGLLAIVFRKPGLVAKISFTPTVLAWAFAMLSIFAGGEVYHHTPFVAATALLYHYSTGFKVPYDKPFARMSFQDFTPMEPTSSWAVLQAWIAVFATTSLLLLKKQKGVPVEENIRTA